MAYLAVSPSIRAVSGDALRAPVVHRACGEQESTLRGGRLRVASSGQTS